MRTVTFLNGFAASSSSDDPSTSIAILLIPSWSDLSMAVLPDPVGPTNIRPWRTVKVSYNCHIFSTNEGTGIKLRSSTAVSTLPLNAPRSGSSR
jgi:hypothetical protein